MRLRALIILALSGGMVLTGCDSTQKSGNLQDQAGSTGSKPAANSSAKQMAAANDLSAHQGTVSEMTRLMVGLMDEVSQKKILSPPVRVSDVRNQFFAVIDWMDELSPEQMDELRSATEAMDALLMDIGEHENATGDSGLQQRLDQLASMNQSVRDALPQKSP